MTQPAVYRTEMARIDAGERGDDEDDWPILPVPPWWRVLRAAKWLGVAPDTYLEMDPYDQAVVLAGMEVESQVAEKSNSRRGRRKG